MSESQPEEAPGAEYVVVWRGMVHKHSVVRTADKVVVKAGFASAAEAKTWLATYEADIK